MKYLIAVLMLAGLSGCATTYDVSRCEANGVCSEASIKSRREFDQVVVDYDRESGTFHFSAGAAVNGTSALEQAAAATILALPQILKPE